MRPLRVHLPLITCSVCDQLRKPHAGGKCRECFEGEAARETREQLQRIPGDCRDAVAIRQF